MQDYPILSLGTAMWGWTVSKESAFALLDAFYEGGFRGLDGATNYPINKRPEDFRRSEKILAEWIITHGVADLEVIMKIGSINNMRGPENNLHKSFILMCLDEYVNLLGPNLRTLMVHWDNRDKEQDISSTLEGLLEGRRHGIGIGLSGILHPEIYAGVFANPELNPCIEIKHNLFHSDYDRYKPFHGARRFIAYGINGGGIKLQAQQYSSDSALQARGRSPAAAQRMLVPLQQLIEEENQDKHRPKISNFNHCGMAYAFHSPDMLGMLIGPSKVVQLNDSLQFHRALGEHDYRHFYQRLQGIKKKYAG